MSAIQGQRDYAEVDNSLRTLDGETLFTVLNELPKLLENENQLVETLFKMSQANVAGQFYFELIRDAGQNPGGLNTFIKGAVRPNNIECAKAFFAANFVGANILENLMNIANDSGSLKMSDLLSSIKPLPPLPTSDDNLEEKVPQALIQLSELEAPERMYKDYIRHFLALGNEKSINMVPILISHLDERIKFDDIAYVEALLHHLKPAGDTLDSLIESAENHKASKIVDYLTKLMSTI